MGNVLLPGSQTEKDIADAFTDLREKSSAELTLITESAQQDVARAEDITQDFGRGILRTVDNGADNFGHTVRFTAKNMISLVDNLQDNVFQTVNDVRVDVANGIQIFFILAGSGILAFTILYGDKILQRGFSLGEIALF